MQERVECLGHLIDREGLHPTETKVAAIQNAPQPTNSTELQSFLGLLNYYGRFMKDLSTTLQPLHQLLKKKSRLEVDTRVRGSLQKRKGAVGEKLSGSPL